MSTSELLILLLFVGLALAGAYSDLRARVIPNWLSAALAVSGLAAAWFAGGAGAAGSALLHLLIALAIGMVLFALKMWGGGDAKFYAGSAAWFTLSELPSLILAISVSGLMLLLVWFGASRIWRKGATRNAGRELPYGVAIAAGGIITASKAVF